MIQLIKSFPNCLLKIRTIAQKILAKKKEVKNVYFCSYFSQESASKIISSKLLENSNEIATSKTFCIYFSQLTITLQELS